MVQEHLARNFFSNHLHSSRFESFLRSPLHPLAFARTTQLYSTTLLHLRATSYLLLDNPASIHCLFLANHVYLYHHQRPGSQGPQAPKDDLHVVSSLDPVSQGRWWTTADQAPLLPYSLHASSVPLCRTLLLWRSSRLLLMPDPRRCPFCSDVDGTLTPARQDASQAMIDTLRALRQECAIAFVGGSDLVKIEEQLNVHGFQGEFAAAERG